MGKVLRPVGDAKAEIEVVRVLKGDHAVGEKVEARVRSAKSKVGRLRVLSSPRIGMGPNFGDLDLRFEAEMRWLVAQPEVDSVDLAITLARGYSRLSRKVGVAYLSGLPEHPTKEILAALAKLRKDPEAATYEVACLVDVLLLKADEVAFEWVRTEVGAFLAGEGAPVDWKEIPFEETSSGSLLTALVGACGETWAPGYYGSGRKRSEAHGRLKAELKKRFLTAMPDLEGLAAADLVYALAVTGTATGEEIAGALPEGKDRNPAALGLYLAAKRHIRWRRWEKARALLAGAEKLASRPELRAAIRKAQPKKD